MRTAVVFWLPTYISQYLGFSTENAAFAFSVATAAISVSTFPAMFVYERLHKNMEFTILLSFVLATAAFAALYFVSYIAGAVSNVLFANAVSAIGWGNLILIWSALMGVGVLVSVPREKIGMPPVQQLT